MIGLLLPNIRHFPRHMTYRSIHKHPQLILHSLQITLELRGESKRCICTSHTLRYTHLDKKWRWDHFLLLWVKLKHTGRVYRMCVYFCWWLKIFPQNKPLRGSGDFKWNLHVAVFSLETLLTILDSIQSSLATQCSKPSKPHSLNSQLSTICSAQQWNISHGSAMVRPNQRFLAALCPCAALGAKSSSWIFWERTAGRSDCWSTIEGLITARRCALYSRGRERKSKLDVGLFFFLSPGLHYGTLVWTRGSMKHVFWPAPNTCPSRWEAPLVYVTPLCAFRWQAGLDE